MEKINAFKLPRLKVKVKETKLSVSACNILIITFVFFAAKQDVTKQEDLSGFYRYILNETTKDTVKQEEDSR